MKNCKDCYYFIANIAQFGECRYNPPTVHITNGGRNTYWPSVYVGDSSESWCGKWADKEKLTRKVKEANEQE